MVSQNSRKIKKPSKFNELVQQKSQKKVKVVENRNALVKEYKARNKTSKVEDRRFLGNRDMDMGQNQKFLGNIERGKKKKMAFFNLDSDDEDLNLTHKGVNLDELDDFKDHEIEKSISDDEGINAEMVDKMHFEGFDEEGDKDEEGFNQRRKSKQEIYKELIHKSKKAKFLRQQQQEENEMKIDELDDNFDTIASLLIRNPNQYKEQKQARGKEDAYQRLQNELAFDKRVKPESVNAQDPKLGRKKKLANQQDQEEESDAESELGIEEDKPAKKKEKKLQTELKAENKTKKFMSFMDDIRNLKNAKDKKDDDDDLDVDDSEEEGDEYDDEEGDDDDIEGGEFDDVDDDDDDDDEDNE